MTNIFVAPKIKVGFRKRSDTFTGQLAYVIYYDEKGKLRKEQSWKTWRDEKIEPQDFDNAPTEGFTINKDIKRYSGEWFSSSRTMIRIHDPRGFEFEVTTENLIGILMHTDCLKRGLTGQFVYAWAGPELVLLPTNSEEYQNAIKYTAGLSKKVSAKGLVPGVSYRTKRGADVVFVGKLNWYEYTKTKKYGEPRGLRLEKKVLVFTSDNGKTFQRQNSPAFLSQENSQAPVSNFAELMDKFNKKIYANKIVKYEIYPTSFDATTHLGKYSVEPTLKRPVYFINRLESTLEQKAMFTDTHIHVSNERVGDYKSTEFKLRCYYIREEYYRSQSGIVPSTGEIIECPNDERPKWGGYYSRSQDLDLAAIQKLSLFNLLVTFENGNKKTFKSLRSFLHGYDEDED